MAATDFVWGRQEIPGADYPYTNQSGALISVNQCLKVDSAHAIGAGQAKIACTQTTAVTDIPMGLAVQNTPAGADGTVQIMGVGVGLASGAITVGQTVGPAATAGQLAVFTSTDPSLGQALSATASAADPFLVLIHVDSNNH